MDELVDRALSTYVPAEPPLGLEQRILARARAPRRRMAFWSAIAAAACAAWAIILLRPFEPQPAIPADIAEAVLPVRAVVPLIPVPSVQYRAIARREARLSEAPKLATFPQIERVPQAEVELARLALNPEIGKALLAEPELTEPEPIHIEALSIKLLDED